MINAYTSFKYRSVSPKVIKCNVRLVKSGARSGKIFNEFIVETTGIRAEGARIAIIVPQSFIQWDISHRSWQGQRRPKFCDSLRRDALIRPLCCTRGSLNLDEKAHVSRQNDERNFEISLSPATNYSLTEKSKVVQVAARRGFTQKCLPPERLFIFDG